MLHFSYIIGLLLFLLPSSALAVFHAAPVPEGTNLEQTLTIKADGQVLRDGEPSKQVKVDILADHYLFRYKVLDSPGRSFQAVAVTVELPSTLQSSEVVPTIYAIHGVDQASSEIVGPQTIRFLAKGVGPAASITVAVSLPSAAVSLPPLLQLQAKIQFLSLGQWLVVAIIIPALMLLFALVILCRRLPDLLLKPPANTSLTSPPAALPPALVGVLLTGYVGQREIAATLIDLARRGYIDIIYRQDGDFGFSRKKPWAADPKILPFERYFLSQLFTGAVVSDSAAINQNLNYQIWNEPVTEAIEQIYESMVKLRYFKQNPKQSHGRIRFVGIAIFFLSVAGFGVSLLFFTEQPLIVIPWLVSLVCSPLILRLALIVPARTEAARDQVVRWLAFRNFLAAASPILYSDTQGMYEKYLPLAVVLGVEGPWTARFTNLPARLPDWFYSERSFLNSYPKLASALFGIIGYVGQRFSYSRKPSAI